MRLWIDVEDLFQYTGGNRRPSGIQRLAFELYVGLRAQAGAEAIGFLRHDPPRNSFAIVPWQSVEVLFSGLTHADEPPPTPASARGGRGRLRDRVKRAAYRLPDRIRRPLLAAARAQFQALRSQGQAILQGIAVLGSLAPPRDAAGRQDAALVSYDSEVAAGDVVAVLGSPWFHPDYAGLLREARNRHGVRILLLMYDIIPVRRPEWCDGHLVRMFTEWVESCLAVADSVLAISRATAEDVTRYAAERGIQLAGPVRAIPIGSGFGGMPAPSPRPAGLPAPGSYVLFVSTIEARKNHALMFRVWRRLLDEMPADEVPVLVFAGRVGWLVQDLMQQLVNADYLGGKIRLIEDPSDSDLGHLYRGCLFTVFPSLYEGWGLPVTESLAFGKPCVISDRTSLPEAGGTLARYVDPEDPAGTTQVIRAILEDRAGLAEWEARVQREFKPVSWEAGAAAILEAVR